MTRTRPRGGLMPVLIAERRMRRQPRGTAPARSLGRDEFQPDYAGDYEEDAKEPERGGRLAESQNAENRRAGSPNPSPNSIGCSHRDGPHGEPEKVEARDHGADRGPRDPVIVLERELETRGPPYLQRAGEDEGPPT